MTHIQLCNCPAYLFAHPANIGECHVEDIDKPACSACWHNTFPITADFGIGPGEAWGQKFVDTDIQIVSDCCEASCINPSTGKNLEPEE